MKWKMLFIACLVASTIGVGAYRGSFLSTKSLWEDNLEPNFGLPVRSNGTIKVPTAPPIDDDGSGPQSQPPVPQVAQPTPPPAQPGTVTTKQRATALSIPQQETCSDCERLEIEAHKLVTELRNQKEKDPAKQEALRKVLADLFDQKLSMQAQEARDLADKLQRLQSNLAERKSKKKTIVDGRLNDLMGTGWPNTLQTDPPAHITKPDMREPYSSRNASQSAGLSPLTNNAAARNGETNRMNAPGVRGAAAGVQNRAAANSAEAMQFNGVAEQLATKVYKAIESMKPSTDASKFANDPEVLRIELEKAKLERISAEVNRDQQDRLATQGRVSQEEVQKCHLAAQKADLEVKLAELKLRHSLEMQKPTPPTREKDNAPAREKPGGTNRRSSGSTSSNTAQTTKVVVLEQFRGMEVCPDQEFSFEEACPFEAAQLAEKNAAEKAKAAQGKGLNAKVRESDAAKTTGSVETQQNSASGNLSILGRSMRLPNPARSLSVAPNLPCAPAPSPLPNPKPMILIKSTVDEVKGRKIILSNGRQYEADAKTEIIQKTENGEKKGKLSDVKSGASIEVEMDKDSKCPKKITVSFIFSMAANNVG